MDKREIRSRARTPADLDFDFESSVRSIGNIRVCKIELADNPFANCPYDCIKQFTSKIIVGKI